MECAVWAGAGFRYLRYCGGAYTGLVGTGGGKGEGGGFGKNGMHCRTGSVLRKRQGEKLLYVVFGDRSIGLFVVVVRSGCEMVLATVLHVKQTTTTTHSDSGVVAAIPLLRVVLRR